MGLSHEFQCKHSTAYRCQVATVSALEIVGALFAAGDFRLRGFGIGRQVDLVSSLKTRDADVGLISVIAEVVIGFLPAYRATAVNNRTRMSTAASTRMSIGSWEQNEAVAVCRSRRRQCPRRRHRAQPSLVHVRLADIVMRRHLEAAHLGEAFLPAPLCRWRAGRSVPAWRGHPPSCG
jgi:hypothetical protein